MLDVPSDSLTAMDTSAVQRLVMVCHDGESFYQQAAKSVEDYAIRRTLLQIANTRNQTLRELTHRLQMSGKKVEIFNTPKQELNLWYLDALEQDWDISDHEILTKLRQLEADNLQSLVRFTRQTQDKQLREMYSNIATRFTLCLDMLDEIILRQETV
ncbi:DUF2383 domain-containing protein [Neptunicella marina]|uniref:DUF2383 domain-containing protein n=1 Tax=Neptunicella marina TaxID=2125989 RepID=A0A8J6M1A5_9ALTE|nr:DUF2383 domain-containing protein [Neptunicella marina]MBC3765338.1 DUF2383 domain-containing protein [Neptunicella marina]